jgi:hypothetical protein
MTYLDRCEAFGCHILDCMNALGKGVDVGVTLTLTLVVVHTTLDGPSSVRGCGGWVLLHLVDVLFISGEI